MNNELNYTQTVLEQSFRLDEVPTINGPISKPKIGLFSERYKLHQYWSRKPWYVVRSYIEKFSKKGDTILDPFSGSGVVACEALITRRKIVAVDINPASIFITKTTCISPINLNKFREIFKEIESVSKDEINSLYKTRCLSCGKLTVAINTIWNKTKPTFIFYSCSCGDSKSKIVDQEDLKIIEKVHNMEIPFWYPQNFELPEDSDVKNIVDLYTKRNLIGLSILYNQIQKLDTDLEKEMLMLMFSSLLVRTSRLIFVNKHRFDKGVNPAGVWGEKRFWIPDESIENNVWHYFEKRFDKIIKGKEETNKLIGSFYKDSDTIRLLNSSSESLDVLKDNSIDYCFTDPPYGGAIQYMGLSAIWNAWLEKTNPNIENEITINKTKNIFTYEEMLNRVFSEVYRVLKPNRYLSITFHSSKANVWNALLRACQNAGFELENIIPQEPLKASHNQIEMKGTVETDLIITFKKPLSSKYVPTLNQKPDIEDIIIEETGNLLKMTDSVSTTEIYDSAILRWINIVYGDSHIPKKIELTLNDIETVLKNNGFEAFSAKESDYKGKIREYTKWRLAI